LGGGEPKDSAGSEGKLTGNTEPTKDLCRQAEGRAQFRGWGLGFSAVTAIRQSSLKRSGAEKLKPRFYGPYRVIRRVGEVAYELELPEGSKIHNVFHVSCLKKAVGQQINTSEELPPLDEEGQLELVPEEVLEQRERRLRNRVIRECLVRWRGLPVEDATWEGSIFCSTQD
jgi:hypothetical protein